MLDVAWTLELASSGDALHAHVSLDSIEPEAGDLVLLHHAPISFSENAVLQGRATVVRAGPLARAWARLSSFTQLSALYEVSFTPRHKP